MKYPKSVLHKDGWRFKADIQHRTSRRKDEFWIIIYSSKNSGLEGWIHLPDDWQDVSRTYTPQDIYWDDKYDCTDGRRGAALICNALTATK